MKHAAWTGMLALVATACASAAPEPAATPGIQAAQSATAVQPKSATVDPAGIFEYSTTVDGTQMAGTFEINRRDDGSYSGRILSPMFPAIPITRVSVEGTNLIIGASMDGQALTMNLNFTGDRFAGTWSFGDGSAGGNVSGKRKAS